MEHRPNIVFLLNDHQIYYRHGWDAGPKIRRPHVERLGAEGVAFSRAYTACPLCGPARRTMLTGLFPHQHGEIKNDAEHPFDRETYLQVLSEHGYRNYYYGKWHAGPGTAHDHGCEGLSYPSYNNPYTKPEFREYLARRGLPRPEICIERNFQPEAPGQLGPAEAGKCYRQEGRWCNEHASGIMLTPKETHEAFFLADLACDTLRRIAASRSEQPFHLRVDFWGPHQPYFPTEEFVELYPPEDIPEYPSFRDDLSRKPRIYLSEGNFPLNRDGKLIIPNPLPWSEWQKVLSRAYAHVTMIDAAGGMILDTLDELGLAENTLVLWTTDHGDALACHGGHFDKRSYMPEEMVRIPMAIRHPGTIPAEQVCDLLVSNIDIAPTLLQAAGASFREKIDGRGLLPVCTGDAGSWRQDLVCETHGHGDDHLGRLVVTERYKYVANQGDMDELYDLTADPYEMENLIGDRTHQDVRQDMQRKLAAWQKKTKPV